MKKIITGFALLSVMFFSTDDNAFPTKSKKKLNPSNSSITLGAYYFDGWTGKTNDVHLPQKMIDSFSEREPVWGWVTSTPQAMSEQIDLAANFGISFFAFDWFYNAQKVERTGYLNHGLNLFVNSPNKSKMNFCILVTNHAGFEIGPDDWVPVTASLMRYMRDGSYLKVNGKPLVIIYSLQTLIGKFGSTNAVKNAFDALRDAGKQSGFGGVEIAANAGPSTDIWWGVAKQCGVDIITGYNYSSVGFNAHQKALGIDVLINGQTSIWNTCKQSGLPYMPCMSVGFDPRAWVTGPTSFWSFTPYSYYTGYNSESVYRSIKTLKSWMDGNPDALTKEHLAVLYAWNEYGEGAWLTPSKNSKDTLLNGIKRALKK